MRALFLVDNSVIQRLAKPQIRSSWDRLRERGDIATCLSTMLEAGFSARSASDHERLMELERSAKIVLEPEPGILSVALRIQSGLFAAGMGRAVGVSDIQIAATAIHHSTHSRPVTVVHYDADFDHVTAVVPEFRSEWIVDRGAGD